MHLTYTTPSGTVRSTIVYRSSPCYRTVAGLLAFATTVRVWS